VYADVIKVPLTFQTQNARIRARRYLVNLMGGKELEIRLEVVQAAGFRGEIQRVLQQQRVGGHRRFFDVCIIIKRARLCLIKYNQLPNSNKRWKFFLY